MDLEFSRVLRLTFRDPTLPLPYFLRRRAVPLILAGIASAWILGFIVAQVRLPRPLVDEVHHYRYVRALLRGDFTRDALETSLLPVIPGYHAGLAIVAKVTSDGFRWLRSVSFGFALCLIPAVWWATRDATSRDRVQRTLSVLAIPFFPLMGWLLYTDLSALLFLVLALGAWRRGHNGASGVLLLLGSLVRQNLGVVGLAFLAADWIDARRRHLSRPWITTLRRGWPQLLGLLPAAALAWSQGDLVLVRTHESPRAFHATQIWFVFLLHGLLVLPNLVRSTPGVLRAFWRRPFGGRSVGLLLLTGLAAAYHRTLVVDHPWNLTTSKAGGMIDGDDVLLAVLVEHPTARALGLVIILLAIVHWIADAVSARRPEIPLLCVAAGTLMLVPSWLVCVRYDLVPLTLMALTAQRPYAADRAGSCWIVALALGMSAAFLAGRVFF